MEDIHKFLDYAGDTHRFWEMYEIEKGGTRDLIFKTSNKWTHLVWNIWSEDDCIISAWISPVVTSYGTPEAFPRVGPVNTNVAPHTNVQLFSNPVVSNPGALVGRWWKDMNRTAKAIFVPNLDYMARIVNKYHKRIRVNLCTHWHELVPVSEP